MQISAGGVAFRGQDSRIEVALISVGEKRRWQLPKGIVNHGESNETAAMREVREEAGIETEMLAPLDKVEYWYYSTNAGARPHPQTRLFLFTPLQIRRRPKS